MDRSIEVIWWGEFILTALVVRTWMKYGKMNKVNEREVEIHYAILYAKSNYAPNSLTSVCFPHSANGTIPLTCISGP